MTALLALLALLVAPPQVPARPAATDAGSDATPVVTMEEVEGSGDPSGGHKAEDGGVITRPRLDPDAPKASFEWTEEQLLAGAHGLGVVRCALSAAGIPHECKVIQGVAGVQSAQLERFVEASRFKPATLNGQAIALKRWFWPIRLVVADDPQFKAKLVAVATPPRFLSAESRPWDWTKEQLAAPKPLRMAALCHVTARGRLTSCAQSDRPHVVSEEQLGDFLCGLRFEPARDKEGNPLDTLNFREPVVLYNP
jgi:hypothetical protein